MVKRLLAFCILVLAASWTVALPAEGKLASEQASWTFGRTGTLALVPEIGVDPLTLEATLYSDEVTTVTLWLTNDGMVDLSFVLHETGSLGPAEAAPTGRKTRVWDGPIVDPQLAALVQAEGQARALIYLRELPDLSPAYGISDREARGRFVAERLLETAVRSGGGLVARLEAAGAAPRRLPIANAVAVRLDAALLQEIANRPEVAHIALDRTRALVSDQPGSRSAASDTEEWNIAKIRADQAWSELGITGQGITIGEIDTGVYYAHPTLVNQYRGALGGGLFDHDYNWFDMINNLPAPYDDNNHGTFGMGVAVGNDGGSNQIGVAPGASWIAVKACTGGGSCSDSDLLAAASWMLAPTRLDGSDPDPAKRPDLVLNMWGGGWTCDPWFDSAIMAWRAANILPLFGGGGYGPSCGYIAPPANSPLVLTAGATDEDDVIGPFSSRGPSPCGGVLKPDVSAPGVDIRSSTADGGYAVWSGMASSTAHLAGTAALVMAADPLLGIDQVTGIITSTALCIEDLSCGGTACPDGANNVYGWGRIDAHEAVALALGGDMLPWLDESPKGGTLAPGEGMAVDVTFDSTGLVEGVYAGWLDVTSDDPATPHVMVPVTLTVEIPCLPVDVESVLADADGCTVTFAPEVTGTEPISYTWDLGPFGVLGEPSPVVDFGTTGSYTGTLTVTNCDGVGHDVQALTVDVECVTLRTIYIPLVVKDP
jgi:hypothetical protein